MGAKRWSLVAGPWLVWLTGWLRVEASSSFSSSPSTASGRGIQSIQTRVQEELEEEELWKPGEFSETRAGWQSKPASKRPLPQSYPSPAN